MNKEELVIEEELNPFIGIISDGEDSANEDEEEGERLAIITSLDYHDHLAFHGSLHTVIKQRITVAIRLLI